MFDFQFLFCREYGFGCNVVVSYLHSDFNGEIDLGSLIS